MRELQIIVLGIMMLLTGNIGAQINPYRYGTPHYWMAQASINIYAGKFDIAYQNLQKARNGYKNLGDITYQVNAIEAMGGLKFNLGEWELANQHYQEALDVAKKGKDNVSHSKILVDIITFYKRTGNISGYSKCISELDSLCKNTSSAEIKTIYHIYWSNEYTYKQEYIMADFHSQQCWDAMLKLPLMEREQAKLSFFNNMIELKKLMKEYDEAIQYAKKYVVQSGIVNGKNSNAHLQAYGCLANLYAEKGDSIQTFTTLDSLRCGVGRINQDNSMLATYYNLRAACYANFNNYEKAIECLEKSNDLLIDKNIEDTPSKYTYYEYKSEVLYRQKKYDEAYSTYQNCVQASKNKYGETSGDYYQRLYTLAFLESERGHTEIADSLFRISMNYLLSNMKQMWTYSTQSQREQFSKETLNKLGGIAAFAIKCGLNDSKLTETCYNALLFSKALLLETEKTVLEILANEGTEEDLNNYRNLLAINSKLLNLRCNYEYNKVEIDSIVITQRDLELQLANKCQLFNEYNDFLDIDYSNVKHKLKDNEIIIDFSDFQTEDSLRQYVAYIINNRQAFPKLVKCFTQEQLDSLQGGEPNFSIYNYDILQDNATQLLWGALQNYVEKGSTIYYVPSGVIHEIAIESLPLADGTILGQHFNFVRLSSAREIWRRNVRIPVHKTATLYGGLRYNINPDILEIESNAYDKSDLAWVFRSEYGDEGFKDLKKTKEEIEKIEQTLTINGYKVKSLSGVKGNAESFIAMSGKSPSILHIATHGFYYTPDEAEKNDYLNGYTDAMSLSGLVFSGGNAAWLKKDIPEGVLGGVLTARDIANLNFKGTDLVVLSACRTAKGKATAEGLFGLQRAFKKAGAGTLILTLWKVRDSVAESFTTTFYKELFNHGGDKHLAFESTKSKMRQKYKDSFDWSCFIMID